MLIFLGILLVINILCIVKVNNWAQDVRKYNKKNNINII